MARGGVRSTSFKPGKSGNPGGRLKGVSKLVVADVRALARTYGEDAIEALVSIMGNAKTPPAARVAAAIAVLDRGWGKPSQRMDMAGGLTLESLIMANLIPDRRRAYGEKMIERCAGFSAKSFDDLDHRLRLATRIHHCGLMGRRMRKVHRDILASGGVSPYRELMLMFGQSSLRRSAFFEGRIVAMGGITGSWLVTHDVAWLVLAEEFRNHPITIVRHAKRLLKQQMQTRSELAAAIWLEDDAGFEICCLSGVSCVPR